MEIPPPMPTALDAIKAVDQAMERATIPTVQAKLKELRGFDASPREVAKALEEWKMDVRVQAVRLVSMACFEFEAAYGGPSWLLLREMEKVLHHAMDPSNEEARQAHEELQARVRRDQDTEKGRKDAEDVVRVMLDGGVSPEEIAQHFRESGLKLPDLLLQRLRGKPEGDDAGTF